MNTKISQGGSAFPISTQYGGNQYGMTLRDYFAAKALPSVIDLCKYDTIPDQIKSIEDLFAKNSYKLADAMIEAREVSK